MSKPQIAICRHCRGTEVRAEYDGSEEWSVSAQDWQDTGNRHRSGYWCDTCCDETEVDMIDVPEQLHLPGLEPSDLDLDIPY